MDAAEIIRESIAEVERLRQEASERADLAVAVPAVKRYQSARFAATYRDLIACGPFQDATRFFLVELYGDANYSERDSQFSRIAGAIQRLMPRAAIATAVALAQLHVLTERLDQAMGKVWAREMAGSTFPDVHARYANAWQLVGQQNMRTKQLRLVLELGDDLDSLTKTTGLRTMLKMMRGPAQAAGLSDLQRFLEIGFDTFAAMGRQKGSTNEFLDTIKTRESIFIESLFGMPASTAKNYLAELMRPA